MAFELKEDGFKLKEVLVKVGIPEATYHYHIKQLEKADPNKEWKELITRLFERHEGRYGYRRFT